MLRFRVFVTKNKWLRRTDRNIVTVLGCLLLQPEDVHAAASIAGNDAPLIGARAAIRGPIAMERGDQKAGVQVPHLPRFVPGRGNRPVLCHRRSDLHDSRPPRLAVWATLWKRIHNGNYTGRAGYQAPASGRPCGQAAEGESIGIDPPGVAAAPQALA